MKAYTRSGIREISRKHGFRRSDSLGQNFLVDKNIIDKIVESAELDENSLVIEIGPGMGALTESLLEIAGKVVTIEIDSHIIPLLEENLGKNDKLEIINQDVLKVDFSEIITREKMRWKERGGTIGKVAVLGNLPYYITTPIIMGILEKEVEMDTMVIMMQKEVAERIVAKPGSKIYGALSIACQFYCETDYVATVPRTVFQPQPKVDSAVLKLDRRKSLPWEVSDRELFFKIVRAGFNQRRKTILNSVSTLDGLEKSELSDMLEQQKIDPRRRAETLSIEDFAGLSNRISENIHKTHKQTYK